MNISTLLATTVGLSFLASTASHAAFTYTKSNSDEAGVSDVMEVLYGGTYTQSGLNFLGTNASAYRIDDGHDQLWTGTFDVKVLARFSGYTQRLGVSANRAFQQIAQAEQIGFDANGDEAVVTLDNEPFFRDGDSGTQSSLLTDNRDGRDHVLTYQVQAGTASPLWLLFWEDLNLNPNVTKGRSSSDYNDLIVMVRIADTQEGPVAVPLPPAFVVGLATLGMGAWFARRRLA